jgi:hypothetical protein
MSVVAVRQLIYTRLESAFSPNSCSGLQTAWQSPGISSSEAAEIVARISSSPLDERANPLQMQYFLLASGAAVCVRSTTIAHPRIIDTHRSSFLAHAFIIADQEFQKLQCDPFAVLLGCPQFVTDAEDLLRRFLRPAIPPTDQITITPPTLPAGHVPAPLVQHNLVEMVLRARELQQAGKTLVFPGSHADTLQTLREIFQEIRSPELRRHLTFSTTVGACAPDPGSLWLAGDLRFNQPGFFRLLPDWTAPALQTSPCEASATGLNSWLPHARERLTAEQMLHNGTELLRISGCQLKGLDPGTDFRDSIAADFLQFFSESAADQTHLQFSSGIPRNIQALAASVLQNDLNSVEAVRAACRRTQCSPEEAARICCDRLLDDPADPIFRRLSWYDWWFLFRFTRRRLQSVHVACILLFSVHPTVRWCFRTAVQQQLQDCDEDQFLNLLRLVPQHVPPEFCCCPRHLSTLLQNLPLDSLSDNQFTQLLRAIQRCSRDLPDTESVRERLKTTSSPKLLWLTWLARSGRISACTAESAEAELHHRINTNALKTLPRQHF